MNKRDIEKYTFRTQWSEEDQTYIASCLEFSSISAHGKSSSKALEEVQVALLEAIKWMEEEGESIPEPFGKRSYSGKYPLRMSPELHRKLAMEAAAQKLSLNQYIIQEKLAS